MNKKFVFITVCGVAITGGIFSVIQYKKVCATTAAMKKDVEELEKYNAKLDAIKQQIESQKGTVDDFIYTEQQNLNRINNTFLRIV